MSRVDDLIAELCPEGVPFQALGDVGEFIRGRRFTKQNYVESGLGAIHYGEIYTDYGTAAMTTRSFVRPELKSSLRLAKTGDLVIAATGENIGDVCKAVAWIGDDEIAIHDDCYMFRHMLDPKYVSYFFQSSGFQDQKVKFASESKVVRVSGSSMARIRMPVPPLEVQREIVRILDAFSHLEAELEVELEAELEARRRQYEHYRDSLLTLERERVRWVTLGEVAAIGTGNQDRKDAVADGSYPFYVRSRDVMKSDTFQFDEEAIVIPGEGGIGEIFHYVSGKFALHQRAYRVHFRDTTISPKFAYYYFTAVFRGFILSKAVSATVTSIRKPMLEQFPVPVPPLEEQQRIVEILDKFDALVNDLSIGLPAELNARRTQYEHYRDRLLTFPEAA